MLLLIPFMQLAAVITMMFSPIWLFVMPSIFPDSIVPWQSLGLLSLLFAF